MTGFYRCAISSDGAILYSRSDMCLLSEGLVCELLDHGGVGSGAVSPVVPSIWPYKARLLKVGNLFILPNIPRTESIII